MVAKLVILCAFLVILSGCELAGEQNVVSFVQSGRDPHLVVPVSLNDGPPRGFILDTGAPVTTILVSPDLLALTQKRTPTTSVRTVSGTTTPAYRLTATSISVGTYRQQPFPYLLLPSHTDLGQTPYGPTIGILGNDFLSHYRLTVDYQSRTISLAER